MGTKQIRFKFPYFIAIIALLVGSGYLGLGTNRYTALDRLATPPSKAQKTPTKIELLHSDILTFDGMTNPDVQKLIGNVSFRHGNATMLCDSAYLNDKEQTFEAFGNVHMQQGDTVNMYARYLFYDGRTKQARLRYNVRLENTTTTLYTDSLDYDRIQDVAYYFDGGSIVDAQNTLSSDYGEFRPATNDAEFRYNVKLVNDSTEMTTNHLQYNTQSRIARFYEDTHIVSGTSGSIDSRRGVYDLGKEVGILLDRSEVRSGTRSLIGDSIYYDGLTKFGEAFGNMIIVDTLQKTNLYGDYGYFDAQRNYAFATSRAYAEEYSQADTLYVGADTLELISVPITDKVRLNKYRLDTLAGAKVDSMDRYLKAFHHVRIFRSDAQAIADSLSYISKDSVMTLSRNPIMWREQRQLQGDTIHFYFKNQKLEHSDVLGQALAIEYLPDGKEYYNQLRGDSIKAYMQDTTVRQIDVFGSEVETIFYMQEEKSKEYRGMNRMTSKDMKVSLDSGAIKKVVWLGEVQGKFYPLEMAKTPDVNQLKGFNWASNIRPKSKMDVIGSADSLGTSRYSLSELKRFSGASAALRAYEPFDKGQDKTQAHPATEQQPTSEQDYLKYIYLLRNTLPDGSNQELYSKYIDGSWVFNISSNKEDHANSPTNPSIGMSEKKNSTTE